MKCLVLVLELREEDLLNKDTKRELLKTAFDSLLEDLSCYDNVMGDVNKGQNKFDAQTVSLKDVFIIPKEL